MEQSKYPASIIESIKAAEKLAEQGSFPVEYVNGYKDGIKSMYEDYTALQTKYDNILATESGHESKTENVWQSGYAAGHEAATESFKKQHNDKLKSERERFDGDYATLRARADKMEQALRWSLYHAKECQEKHGITAVNLIPAIEEALNQQPAEPTIPQQGADDWVSVDDQLPTEGGRYWCYVQHLTDLGFSYFQWNCAYNENERRFSDMALKDGEIITHWRKLPDPPKLKPVKPTCQLPTGCNDWGACEKDNGCRGKKEVDNGGK